MYEVGITVSPPFDYVKRGGNSMKGFAAFSNALVMLEMKNPERSRIDKLFISLGKAKVVLLGALTGALTPIIVCLPLLLYLAVGFVYSSAAEFLVPGVTGFEGISFSQVASGNAVFFAGIMKLILKYTVLPSLVTGILDVYLRSVSLKDPKSEKLPNKLYTRFAAPIAVIYIPLIVLTWGAREAMFGALGLLFLDFVIALFLGFIYRCALLVTMDKVLQVALKMQSFFTRLSARKLTGTVQ